MEIPSPSKTSYVQPADMQLEVAAAHPVLDPSLGWAGQGVGTAPAGHAGSMELSCTRTQRSQAGV